MQNWSIARRLKIGLGSLAGVIVILAVGAVGSALFLRGEFTEFQAKAEMTIAGADLAEDLFEAQIAADAYARQPDPRWIGEFESNLAEVSEMKDVLLDDPYLTDQKRAILNDIYGSLGAFSGAFEDTVARQAERDALFATLAALGPQARETLTQLMDAFNRSGDAGQTFSAARAQENLMRGRFNTERFLKDSSPDAFAEAEARLSEAAQQLSWMSTMVRDQRQAELMAQAEDLIGQYLTAALAIRDVTLARDAATARLSESGNALFAQTDDLLDGLANLRSSISERINTTFAATAIALAAAAALALGYAVIMTRVTVNRITRDFDATLDTVSELADGNLDVEIDTSDEESELGQIAQALEVFRTRGKEAAELALQNEQAKKRAAEEEKRRDEEQRAAEIQRRDAEAAAAETRKREIFDALRAAVSGVVSAAAAGDFSRRVDTEALDPELSSLAEEINRLMSNVDAGLSEIAKVSERLADGDLRAGMSGQFEGTFRALQENIEAMIASLGKIVSDISTEAEGVSSQSSEMTRGAEDLARRAESQAASLEQTSAAMTQIASSAESNAGSAAETDAAASAMSQEAEQARKVLEATIAAMTDIEEHSKEIEAIVDVIEDIAFQTNLLSLNASVEAARAGEAGKGFAVVANEVRALAQRSAEASSKVQQIISQSTGAITRGSGAVGETGDALSRIVERVEIVSSNLREIKNASDEQATAVSDISNAFAQLDKITQRNAAVAEETRGAAALLSSQSERMQVAVQRVRVRDGGPLASAPAPLSGTRVA